MLRLRNYDLKRTDLKPGQPVIGGHTHAPKSRKDSVSKIDPNAIRAKKKKSAKRAVQPVPVKFDTDDESDPLPAGVPAANNDARPMGVKDFIMWKLVKIGRPRQP